LPWRSELQAPCHGSAGSWSLKAVTHLPSYQFTHCSISPLRLVRICAFFVLRGCDGIAWQSRVVDAGAVRVSLLFVGWTVALDGAFVDRQFFSHNLAFLGRKEDLDLVHALDYALDRLQEKGTSAEIFSHYLPSALW
jgi:hypothetical protein